MIVWLGRDDQHSGTAMRLMADISLIKGQILREVHGPFPEITLWADLHKKYQDYLQRLLNNRHSVENFLRRPYWTRLWIVQEFVLAQDLLLVCGPHAIRPTALDSLISVSYLPRWFQRPSFITIPESVLGLVYTKRERRPVLRSRCLNYI